MDDVLRRQADRLAAAGYLTLGAGDMFSDGGVAGCVVGTFKAMATGKGKAFCGTSNSDGSGWPRTRTATARSASSASGWVAASRWSRPPRGFDAAAANYGALPCNAEKTLAGTCRIVASYGKSDLMMAGMAGKLEKALTSAGVTHDVKAYPDAGHSFLNDQRAEGTAPHFCALARVGPQPEAAADAWERIPAFFAQYLASSPDPSA